MPIMEVFCVLLICSINIEIYLLNKKSTKENNIGLIIGLLIKVTVTLWHKESKKSRPCYMYLFLNMFYDDVGYRKACTVIQLVLFVLQTLIYGNPSML
jgi:hypothetical protein